MLHLLDLILRYLWRLLVIFILTMALVALFCAFVRFI